jgi:hypothetical protein
LKSKGDPEILWNFKDGAKQKAFDIFSPEKMQKTPKTPKASKTPNGVKTPKNPKTPNGVKTPIADKTPKTPKNETKKRKAEESSDALPKKKLKTKKQATLFDHFGKSETVKAEKPIVLSEKIINMVDLLKNNQDRTSEEYWEYVKKIVGSIMMNTIKWRETLFEVIYPNY